MFSELELLEMSRIRASFAKAAACVGCGICQYRCHTLYVARRQILDQSAIRVFAGHEHRL
jgi:Pyruvate/2-oxoacid:ferredoxin oxidoreductase delta subunit